MTIYDIAREANVSPATVSRVINGKENISPATRQKIQVLLDKYSYTPNAAARGLASRTLNMVGILAVDIRNVHHAATAYTIEQEMSQLGYGCITCSVGFDPASQEERIAMLVGKGIDGLILIGSVFQSPKISQLIKRLLPNIPVVLANGELPLPNVGTVLVDEAGGFAEGVRYLWDKGHRDIAYLKDSNTISANIKLSGYQNAMEQFTGTKGHYFSCDASTLENGCAVGKEILQRGQQFTALLCAEDISAIGVMKVFAEAGKRVPDDLEIIGCNNSIYGKLCTPTLSSLDNQLEAMGVTSARMLADMISGRPSPKKIILPMELILRESCRC